MTSRSVELGPFAAPAEPALSVPVELAAVYLGLDLVARRVVDADQVTE